MKNKLKFLVIAIIVTTFVFGACENGVGGKGGSGDSTGDGGSLSISVGTPGRAALSGSDLTHKITVTDNSGKEQNATILPGGGPAKFSSLAIGWCFIEVKGYSDNEQVSYGEGKTFIKSGQNGSVPIVMNWLDNVEDGYILEVANITQWTSAIDAISSGVLKEKSYTIKIIGSFTIPGTIESTFNASGIPITINGNGNTLTLSSNGSILVVGSGDILTLENIKLQGKSNNNASLVTVNGNLEMKTGSLIFGNTNSGNGGGVIVNTGGTFEMKGGTIGGETPNDANTAQSGGGVYVAGGGEFTMNGSSKISGNTAENGGGVTVYNNGNFKMNNSSKINNNTCTGTGGGVYLAQAGSTPTFEMEGGTISGNTCTGTLGYGGGVYVGGGIFKMNNSSVITGNQAVQGGGVWSAGQFLMGHTGNSNPVISGNTAATSGGGVLLMYNGIFQIVNGIIYGIEASDALQNTVTNMGNGAALNNTSDNEPDDGRAEYGTYSGSNFSRKNYLKLGGTETTIKVVNGALQP